MRSAFIAAWLGIASQLSAQEGLRFGFAAGPTLAIPSDRTLVTNVQPCPACQPLFPAMGASFDVITGAEHGKNHYAVSVTRSLPGLALVARGEVLFSRITSPPRPYAMRVNGVATRSALRDNAWIGSFGFEWAALPGRAVTPYILTTAGIELNRIGWSRDSSSRRVDEWRNVTSSVVALGGGVRGRVGRRELVLEWRKYTSRRAPGSFVAPLSVGLRF